MTDLNAQSASLLSTLLEVTLQATLCLAVILVARAALKKYLRPDWRYALWGVLILRMLLPFSYNAPLVSYSLPRSAPEATQIAPAESPSTPTTQLSTPSSSSSLSKSLTDNAPTAQWPDDQPDSAQTTKTSSTERATESLTRSPEPAARPTPVPVASTPRALPWATLAAGLWLTGAVLVLGSFALRHRNAVRALERDAEPAPEPMPQLLRQLREEVGLSVWPPILISPSIATPTLIGIFRPRILLPQKLAESASAADLRLILLHELMHLRHRDLWLAWLWLVALSAHWFNPLMWWAGARIRRDREQACDHRVLRALPEADRAAYGHTLVNTMSAITATPSARLAGAAAIVEDHGELEGRLKMIMHYRPTRTRQFVGGVTVAAALAVAAFTQVWGYAAESDRPPLVSKLMDWSLILKKSAMQEKSQKYPAVIPLNASGIFAPAINDSTLIKDEGIESLFHMHAKDRAIYFGYLIPNAEVARAFLDAYEAKNPAIEARNDIQLESEVGGFDRIFVLRDGIERALITDINDPNALGKARSEVPTLWMFPKPGETSAYVLYLDGHVEKLDFPGKFPLDTGTVERVRKIIDAGRDMAHTYVEIEKTSSDSGSPADARPSANPFAAITDEAQLITLRDEAAKAGDIVRACDAEMRRVKLRAANGNPYKDKIDFTDVYRALPPAATQDEKQKRWAAASQYADDHNVTKGGDSDYWWRAMHLTSLLCADVPDSKGARGYLEQAIQVYPDVKYADPSKQSKLQHLVNELAMRIWDQDGVDAAEKFLIDTWKKDRRFVYFYDAPWEARYQKEGLGPDRLAKLVAAMGEKAPLIQVTILVLPDGLWYVEKRATWQEIEGYLNDITGRFNYFIALGYTSDDMPLKTWRDAQTRLTLLTKDLGFDHFSDIGQQPVPDKLAQAAPAPPASPPPSADVVDPVTAAIDKEIAAHYAKTAPEVQEFIRTTAKSFGRSKLWLPEEPGRKAAEERVEYLSKLFEDSTYGRHLCEALAESSVTKDKRLVPGLIKVAAYHRDDQDYDCRPKWMAIAALARQEDESAVPTLVRLVDHGNLNTRMWAQAALARLTEQSFGPDKQAWANWWNAAGNTPALTAEDIKPWVAPGQKTAEAKPISSSAGPLIVDILSNDNFRVGDLELDFGSFRTNLDRLVHNHDSIVLRPSAGGSAGSVKLAEIAAREAGFKNISVVASHDSGTPTENTNVAQSQTVKAPVIVSTVPAIGDTAVPADTKELRVTFDQDMDAGFSWTGGGPAFPESAGKAQWLDKRTCVFPVKLQPGKYYRLGINAPSFRNFQSTSGLPAPITSFWFVTAGANGKPVDALQAPKVVELSPANGAKEVSAATTELVVRFDRPMADGDGWGNPENQLPHIIGGSWRDEKTCVLQVKLEPGKEYILSLNDAWSINFQSAEGVPLAPVRYTFSTKGN